VSDGPVPTSLPNGLDIPAEDWQQTPHSVLLVVLALLKRLAALEERLNQNSSNFSRPPSTDAPASVSDG
jgi:transposase